MQAIQILENEHRLIRPVLRALQDLVNDAARTGSLDTDAALDATVFLVNCVGRWHHAKVGEALLPLLRARGLAPGPLNVITCQLQESRWYLRSLEPAARGAARGERGAAENFLDNARGCHRFLDDAMHRAERDLFPAAARGLSDDDDAALVSAFAEIDRTRAEPGMREACIRIARSFEARARPVERPRISTAPDTRRAPAF